MPAPLPIVGSCEGCSACCRVVTLPPFRRVFGEAGEEAWERLRWDRPDLRAGFLEAERALKAAGAPSFGSPCLWLDVEAGRCRHYEHRPRDCREFAVGGVDCLDARRRAGVAGSSTGGRRLGYNRAPQTATSPRGSPPGMTSTGPIDLNAYIRDVPDFPKPGILFKDITPLLAHPIAFQATVDRLAEHFRGRGIDAVAAAEARGFLFGAPLALRLGVGFVPIRKPGKLPYEKIGVEYALEYGTDRLEVHRDAFAPGGRILLLDDVLATGGTMVACRDLVGQAGAEVVAFAFVVELTFLDGRAKLEPGEVFSLLSY